MTEQTIPTFEKDEISLLDVLVTLAESWKLLVFGPLIVGVIAGGLSFLWPKTFESVAILRLSEEELALLYSAPVLDPLIVKYGVLEEAGGIFDDARVSIKKRMIFAIDKKTKLATLTVKGNTPDEAQAIAKSAIESLIRELQVKGKDKKIIEKTIEINNQAINTAEDALDTIQSSIKKWGGSDLVQESTIKNLTAINSDIARRRQENEVLFQRLEPRGVELYVQEPNLPYRKVSPRRSIIVLSAVFATGFILLIFVFIRKAMERVLLDAESVNKLAAIKRSLGLQKF